MEHNKPLAAATFPTTHEEAMRANPYEVARVWGGRMDWVHQSDPAWTPQDGLRELAALSTLAYWTTRWQGSAVHAALRGGASLYQVARALGTPPHDVATLWREWAAGQVAVHGDTEGRVGLNPAERDQVAAAIDAELAELGVAAVSNLFDTDDAAGRPAADSREL
ncbi:hypothetical protein GA0070622_0061 [Micromonospora sediminicola]|uniref:Uncharacterized protein n=1 Tax=Micromonospora sediminicola TaxID=946078 RepID=A0A1A9B1W3_9ACTN|nr:hypothetical protein [Micromonospora sediminicola]SBT63108.1 hypothetical protein GA0070622_0049 [Micromonospora sediminicola]SBT63120.1 hypothetical protein GA0070622_0061 [Micromonospora sediminicola]